MRYRVFDITGIFDPNSFEVPILTQVRRPDDIAIAPESYASAAFIGTQMRWQNPIGTPTRSLKNGVGITTDGRYYVGEGVNEVDMVIYPPEALITSRPVAGETIETHSIVLTSPDDNTVLVPDFHWKYRTIQHFDVWGNYADCWRTGLWEYTSSHVYNYVFSKNFGMVDFWHGGLAEGNVVTGMRYYAAG